METAAQYRHCARIAAELSKTVSQVEAVARLLAEDATVPFIARYRKEATGSLDEVDITAIRDRLEQLAELDKRRDAILASLEERNLLTDALRAAVMNADSLAALEDVYLPFRPKRRTRAMMAREKGLEPLADWLLAQNPAADPAAEATRYLDPEKGVSTVDEALAGARDIIAERIAETPDVRSSMRECFAAIGHLSSSVAKGKEEEGAKFRDYFEWTEPVAKAPGHRILAMLRGEEEGVLKVGIRPPETAAMSLLEQRVPTGASAAGRQVRMALEDGYDRLLAPAMETEIRAELKQRADTEAIDVFVRNMRDLLMAAPFGRKSVLAVDPGFRTGCKVVVLDPQGKLLHDTVIYPTLGPGRAGESAATVRDLCTRYGIAAIAIGNGTASRETEGFLRGLGLPNGIQIVVVNESGASIYSASDVARTEFPDKDITVRGAVSIGRRLMDPLAELVKLDPKTIGVGQYQHDVDQTRLRRSLDDTVMHCVNAVGVEVNTASRELLAYVSGLGPKLADNIIRHRDENGPFRSRRALRDVPRLGPKAFEQAAGFLRIHDGPDPLDASAVHPERYALVAAMAKDLDCTVADLIRSPELRARIDVARYVSDSVGLPTLRDILDELAKPGRDPREQFEAFAFSDQVHELKDLAPGMRLPGLVTNVTRFGAFVDIGVHQDGLVHVSELADRFVNDPADVVKVHQRVTVTVLEVDIARHRIALSMRTRPEVQKEAGSGRTAPNSDASPSRARPAHDEARRTPDDRHPSGTRRGPGHSGHGGGNWLEQALKRKP